MNRLSGILLGSAVLLIFLSPASVVRAGSPLNSPPEKGICEAGKDVANPLTGYYAANDTAPTLFYEKLNIAPDPNLPSLCVKPPTPCSYLNNPCKAMDPDGNLCPRGTSFDCSWVANTYACCCIQP